MGNFLNLFQGQKMYIGFGVGILVGVVEMMGIDVVESITKDNAMEFIWMNVMGIFGRSAVKKIETPANGGAA